MIFAANFTWDAVCQLTATGIINGAAYGLLGVGFALILGVSGRFHFAYSFTYTLAAYLVFWFVDRAGVPFWISARARDPRGDGRGRRPSSASSTAASPHERAPTRSSPSSWLPSASAWPVRTSSACCSRRPPSRSTSPAALRTPITWGPVVFRWIDVWQVLSAVAIVLGLTALLRFTPLGRAVRATRGNPEMARIIGIDPNQIYLVVFALGTLCCGVAAFWFGVKYSVQPDMGFEPVVFAFVVAFLAGTASSPVPCLRRRPGHRPHRAAEHDLAGGPLEPARRVPGAPALPRSRCRSTRSRIAARLRPGTA